MLSVLIVNWNTCAATLACLDSLHAAAAPDTSYETVVVDNGSTDGSRAALEFRDDITLIVNDENRGFAVAVNQAYRAVRGDLVLLLGSDLALHHGSLDELRRFLDHRPGVAGVGPRYLNPDGSFQPHHYRLPTFPVLIGSVSGLRRLGPFRRAVRRYRMLDDDFSCPRVVEQPSASCLLLRRAMLPPDRLLDESFPIYFNDVVLARGLAERGAQLWMTPKALVVHQLGGSTRLLGHALARQHLASLVRYSRLSQPRHRLLALQLLVLLGALVQRLFGRPAALDWPQLTAALRGDPGPLPELPVAQRGGKDSVSLSTSPTAQR